MGLALGRTEGADPRGRGQSESQDRDVGPVGIWAGVGQLLTGVHSPQPRQNLLQAAGNVGQASGELLQQIGESDTDPHFQVGDLPNPRAPASRW